MSTESVVATFPGDSEDGFTLVEILVVIIIIGILAAVAIPIFLNQQRAARDSATIQDARNLVTNIETVKASIPQPTRITIRSNQANHNYYTLVVSDGDKVIQRTGSKTIGTRVNAYLLPNGVDYHVTAWNEQGKEYNGTKPGEAVLLYESRQGKSVTWKYS